MRILRLSALCLVLTVSASSQGQALPEPLVRLLYEKIDLPSSMSHTCLTVFPDGRFHMEQGSFQPRSAAQIFEGSLPSENLNSLGALIEAEDLKNLPRTQEGMVTIAQGQAFSAVIHRGKEFQLFRRISLEGSGTQHPKPLPKAVEPLLQWFQSSTKAVRQQKLPPLKTMKSTNCGFPQPD